MGELGKPYQAILLQALKFAKTKLEIMIRPKPKRAANGWHVQRELTLYVEPVPEWWNQLANIAYRLS
jgi:hypothetical protein